MTCVSAVDGRGRVASLDLLGTAGWLGKRNGRVCYSLIRYNQTVHFQLFIKLIKILVSSGMQTKYNSRTKTVHPRMKYVSKNIHEAFAFGVYISSNFVI